MAESTTLENSLSKFLKINNNDAYNEDEDKDEEDEVEEDEDDLTAAILAQSGYAQSNPPESPSIPSPAATPDVKLISAFKGSREKHGLPARKVTVSFPEDVYDPPPTAGTLVKRTNSVTIQTRIEKKKDKQKPSGKAADLGKGKGKGKDKKKGKKFGGSSNRCKKSNDDDDSW